MTYNEVFAQQKQFLSTQNILNANINNLLNSLILLITLVKSRGANTTVLINAVAVSYKLVVCEHYVREVISYNHFTPGVRQRFLN